MTSAPEEEPVELELDCRDDPCPRPVIELGRHLGDVPVGSLLAVVARDVAARSDVPAWCRMRGQEYVGERVAEDGVPVYVVRRVGGSAGETFTGYPVKLPPVPSQRRWTR